MKRLALAVLALIALPAAASEDCGSPFVKDQVGDGPHQYGPYDYSNAEQFRDKLPIVEKYHLTPEIYQEAVSGKGRPNLVDDLDYTLRAFPNHARALYAMGILQESLKKRSGTTYLYIIGQYHTAECYLQRALEFKPDDAAVYAAYGTYLFGTGQKQQALPYLTRAVDLAPDSAEYNYNLGLALLEKGDLERSRACAEKAYAGGYPLAYLRNRLSLKGMPLETKTAVSRPSTKNADSTP